MQVALELIIKSTTFKKIAAICILLCTGIWSSYVLCISRTAEGLEDTSKYPNLFAALLEDKKVYWSQQDLAKLASGNLIRVFKQVEQVRDALKMEKPYQQLIPIGDLGRNTYCMSDAGLERAP